MQCILCEKPSAAENYAKALGGFKGTFNGKSYQIVNSVGHIFSMPGPEEQVSEENINRYKSWDINNLPWNHYDLAFNLKLNNEHKDTFKNIKDVADKCDEFVIATDDDPTGEGTLLANEIINALKLKNVRYYRSFHVDESEKEIKKAMSNLKDLGTNPKDDPDYKKALFRSKWDYMSMQWTRIFTSLNANSYVLRQGRLKSYMVWAVGEQLNAVNNYQKIPFYESRFKDENGNVYASKKEQMYPNKEDVPINNYQTSTVVIDSETKKTSSPPGLYDLNMLSASLAPLGFNAKQVLNTYQKMYNNQVVSYPRTEDKTITNEQFNEFLEIADKVARVVGVDPELLTHKTPRSTHVVDAGSHGANRPGSNVPNSLAELEEKYGKCGSVIYQFVARNALTMLCEDYVYNHQEGHIKDYPDFKGSVNLPISLGYKKVFDDDKKDKTLPLKGDANPFIYEGFPPKPQAPTAKWLAKQLEKNDVGTGATRVSIYSDVTDQKTKYPLLIDTKGKITMTEYGEMSYKLLKDTHIGDVKLTENVQKQMKAVASGEDADKYLEEIKTMILEDIVTVKNNAQSLPKEEVQMFECPICGKPMKKSKFGYYCSGYKKDDESSCKFAISYSAYGGKLSDNDVKELFEEGRTHKKIKLTSKAGKKYEAILAIIDGKVAPEFEEVKETAFTCPKCGEFIKVDSTGYACSNFKKTCDFKIYKTMCKKEIPENQIMSLLTKGRTSELSGFVGKSGKKFSAKLKLNEETKKVEFEF